MTIWIVLAVYTTILLFAIRDLDRRKAKLRGAPPDSQSPTPKTVGSIFGSAIGRAYIKDSFSEDEYLPNPPKSKPDEDRSTKPLVQFSPHPSRRNIGLPRSRLGHKS